MPSSPIYRNRDFILLWLGQLVSETGNRVYSLALMWWALTATGSALKMGTVMAFWTIPFVVLGPVAGAWVDRHNRKVIIVGMDVVRGIIVVIVATLAFMNRLLLWHVYLAISFESIGTAFFMPAVTATIPNIVSKKDLTKANSLSQLVRSVVGVAGPALGGLLIAIVGIPAVFLINGISYLLSAGSETFIRVPPLTRKIEEQKHIIRETYAGFRFIKNDRMLFGLVSVSCILNFFAAPIIVLIPVLVKQILHLEVKHV
ncbi:MAG TPA: MFS transporter, partial [bacterium (Candidatus Stahlbacteria)]|nr:MFS transporter [Candidatus Stahlbacteria bacterium]